MNFQWIFTFHSLFSLNFHFWSENSIWSFSQKWCNWTSKWRNWNCHFLCLRQYKFLPWCEAYSLFKAWWFFIINRVVKALESLGDVCYNEHPRGRGECSLWVLKMGRMWLAKVARRGENLVQYLKISLDILFDAKTFDNQVKAYLQACLQGRSRRLLREPLLTAKKRKAPPWIRWRSQGVYVWVFSLFYVPLSSVNFF